MGSRAARAAQVRYHTAVQPPAPPATPSFSPPSPPVEPCATLVLDRARPLTEGVVLAFARVLAYAEGWSRDAAREPVKAVHEVRKSIRRARAAVRLARPCMGPKRFKALDQALRQAVLETSSLRDAEVITDTVETLAAQDPTIADVAAALRARLGSAQATATEAELTAGVLGRSAACLAGAPERFAAALRDKKGRAALDEPGAADRLLRESFKRVRATFRGALLERTDEAIHDWRKRVKELRYQLELLELPPASGDSREEALGDQAKALGWITDLLVLRVRVRELFGELGEEAAGRLLAVLDARIPMLLDEVAREAAPFYVHRASDFARVALRAPAPPIAVVAPPHFPPSPSQPGPASAGPGDDDDEALDASDERRIGFPLG